MNGVELACLFFSRAARIHLRTQTFRVFENASTPTSNKVDIGEKEKPKLLAQKTEFTHG